MKRTILIFAAVMLSGICHADSSTLSGCHAESLFAQKTNHSLLTFEDLGGEATFFHQCAQNGTNNGWNMQDVAMYVTLSDGFVLSMAQRMKHYMVRRGEFDQFLTEDRGGKR